MNTSPQIPTPSITPEHADQLAERAHGEDRTKSGILFIEHVRRVAAHVASDPDPYAVPAALLHDAIEKGAMRWADLREAGADDRLIAIIDALTERVNELEHDYLARCAADPLALRIKRADVGDKLVLSGPAAATDLPTVHAEARQRLDLLERLAPQHAAI